MTLIKSLDEKLSRIAQDGSATDFILADAKDADMAFGIHGLGMVDEGGNKRPRQVSEFRQSIRENVAGGLIDIMLMSVSNSDQLTVREQLFANSPVTPAIRANDSTDIWLAGSPRSYGAWASIPFRIASLDHALGGKEGCTPQERQRGVNLGLYSITLNHDAELDARTLQAYTEFRREAELKGFRHFLEIFPPNASKLPPQDWPRFINDSVVRLLAGIALAGRPILLKVPYLGPAAMEELASYDSSLVVGIMGGSAGTTFDAFHMLWEAKKHGARAALFGRKINYADNQLAFIRQLRALADGLVEPVEAVKSYHGDLERLGFKAQRTLEDDLRPGKASD